MDDSREVLPETFYRSLDLISDNHSELAWEWLESQLGPEPRRCRDLGRVKSNKWDDERL